ncbi:MAG: hypothetical protein QME52_08530 [Bacteroidota bacterium]|nr:hypothetical protein [Bacteroidota bacterium]
MNIFSLARTLRLKRKYPAALYKENPKSHAGVKEKSGGMVYN